MAWEPNRAMPLSVLVVEDSEDDAELVIRALRRGGLYPRAERVDTHAAMDTALRRQTWDLVISDYSMPQFSGPAALALVRGRGLDTPFIIVSGVIGEDAAVAAMKAGAHDYIRKGDLARLVPAVERELREAEMRGQRARASRCGSRKPWRGPRWTPCRRTSPSSTSAG